MFDAVDTLEIDLRQFADGGYRLALPFRLGSSEVGKALIQLAAGKPVDALGGEREQDRARSGILREAATQFVAGIMLGPSSDHFTTLGVSPEADPSVIRDNFRRLMALVHPDAQPVGFPADAASRVNRAYAVLSESGSRAAYAARELGLTPFEPVVFNAEPSLRRASASTSEAGGRDTGNRLLGWLRMLRARQSLLWVAALLLLPVGALVISFFSYERPRQLVEARPRVKFSANLETQREATRPVDIVTPPPLQAALDRRTATPTATASGNSSADDKKQSSPTIAKSPGAQNSDASPDSPLKYSFALQTTTKSSEPPPSSPLSVSLAATPARAVPAVPSVDATVKVTGPSLAPGEPARASEAQQIATHMATPAVAPQLAVPVRTVAVDRIDANARIRSADAEAIVIRFSNAYESGSIGAFGQLFAPGMSGRRQMLGDYERVFSSTRQRTIKFNQLKHAVSGERLSTSGYAVVTTTDQDNRTLTQRVFLEFEIGRDQGEPRIERLANYVIN